MDQMPQVIPIYQAGDYESHIARGAQLLHEGKIVVLPTETVYGAAGLLTHPQANASLRDLRGNAASNGGSPASPPKPFTIHLPDPSHASRFLGDIGELGRRMISKLWPGPVALIFDVQPQRQTQVAADLHLADTDLFDGSHITLRCPDHIVFGDVVGKVDGPVAMTLVDSTRWDQLDNRIELVFDAGPSKYSKPSTIVHVLDDHYEIVREGVYDRRIIERMMRTTILFVCSGNTCRSPMSEALARRQIADKLGVLPEDLEKKGITVISAGSFALPGAKATPQAAEAVRSLGGDLSRHRSRPLTVELIHQADMIFTMSRAHAAAVAALVPSASAKTVTLNPAGDIEDPIGGELSLYQSLAGQLNQLIQEQVVSKLTV